MIEIFTFVLAALIGVMIGINLNKYKIQKRNNKKFEKLNHNYFKGLNYLLNDDSDKAIDVFIDLAKSSSETFEPQLALGNLYRRRGEVDKAIKLHQALISKPNLPEKYRTKALLAMGKDYMSAGLLDRAEVLFTELVEIEAYTPEALYSLCEIYQKEQDWSEAIKSAERYETVSDRSMSNEISHFYCELAEKSIESKNANVTKGHLSKALKKNPRCVRAKIIQAKIYESKKQWKKAIVEYQSALDMDNIFASELLQSMSNCYSELKQCHKFDEFLRNFVESYNGITPVLILANRIKQEQGLSEAEEFVQKQLDVKPSVRGLELLLKLNLENKDNTKKEILQFKTLDKLVVKLLDKKPLQRCRKCGFGAKKLHWHCPSCKSWGSVKPIFGLESE